jgi:hypothetical protein
LALGKDWQPQGATAEGDVKTKQHIENTPLTRYWSGWNGQADPDSAYPLLANYLESLASKR